jgi:Domain of unknown function (DUF4258)
MISEHAKHRMQQRGIPLLVIDWLLEFGQTRYDHRGAMVYVQAAAVVMSSRARRLGREQR